MYNDLRFGSCFVVLFAQNMAESFAHASKNGSGNAGVDFDRASRVGDEGDPQTRQLREDREAHE